MNLLSDRVLDHLREVVEVPDLDGTPYEMEREIGRGVWAWCTRCATRAWAAAWR